MEQVSNGLAPKGTPLLQKLLRSVHIEVTVLRSVHLEVQVLCLQSNIWVSDVCLSTNKQQSISTTSQNTHTHHKSTAKASKTNSAVPMSLATLVTIYRIMGNTHNCDRVVPHSLKLTCTGLTGRTWGRFLCQLPWRA